MAKREKSGKSATSKKKVVVAGTKSLNFAQTKLFKMDLTKTVVPGSYTLSVSGADVNGAPASIGPASFTSESGSQAVSPIDGASATVSVGDTAPGVIRVDANDTVDGSGTVLTARLSLNPATPLKAVSLTLTLQ